MKASGWKCWGSLRQHIARIVDSGSLIRAHVSVTTMNKQFTPYTCDSCVYLGQIEGECDLYYCSREKTLIARYGNEPEDYVSGMPLVKYDPRLQAAYTIATMKELIKTA